jgi:hypothetical protein
MHAKRLGSALRVISGLWIYRERRKKRPASRKQKARCNRTNTPHSKATRRKAKPNEKPQTPTRGARQASTSSVEGRARPRTGARPAARVATYAPDRHRDALPRQRATPSSRSAPEMKAASPDYVVHYTMTTKASTPEVRCPLLGPLTLKCTHTVL